MQFIHRRGAENAEEEMRESVDSRLPAALFFLYSSAFLRALRASAVNALLLKPGDYFAFACRAGRVSAAMQFIHRRGAENAEEEMRKSFDLRLPAPFFSLNSSAFLRALRASAVKPISLDPSNLCGFARLDLFLVFLCVPPRPLRLCGE